MARGGGTASDGGAPGAPGRSGGAPGVPFEDVDLPATVRIGRPGTPDRALRVAAACLVAGLALAFAKPWSWGSPAAAPTQAPDVIATPAPAASAVPAALAPRRWTDLGASGSCLSNRLWMAVVDEEDDGGRTVTRSWTRLDPVPASDPTDPGIVRARVYAEAVPRIGFCAPAAAGTTERRLAVAAWRLEPGTAPDEATAVPIEPVILAGGAVADGGALYGPPTSSRSGIVPGEPGSPTAGGADARGAHGVAADPEVTWSVDGGGPWQPHGWTTGPEQAGAGGWLPGTYVFRVAVPGAAADDAAIAWVAVELRGPWPGTEAAPPDASTPQP